MPSGAHVAISFCVEICNAETFGARTSKSGRNRSCGSVTVGPEVSRAH